MSVPRGILLIALLMAAILLAAAPLCAQDEDVDDGEGEEQEETAGRGDGSWAGTLRGQQTAYDPEFHPTYKLTFDRDQDVSSWKHNFSMNYSFTPKVAFNASSNIVLRENEALERLNRQETWNAGLTLALSEAISTGIRFRRTDQEDVRNPGESNEVRTFRERESFKLTTDYRKTFLDGIGVTLGVAGGFEKNEYANVRSRGSSQSVNAGLNYTAPMGIATSFQYSGGHSLLDSEQGALESTDESFDHNLSGHFEYTWMSNAFVAEVKRGVSSKEYPKEEQTEHRRADTDAVNLKADLKLVENLTSLITLGYTRSRTEYSIETSKDNDLKARSVRASLGYAFGDTKFTAEMNSEKKRNEYYDTQTGNQYSNALGASITQDFGDKLRAVVRGRTSLLSHQYDDIEENNQDRDLYDQEATLQVDYTPRSDIRTSLYVKVREDNLIYIRTSRTGDNKTSQSYTVQPSIRKSFGDRVSVSQKYGLSADYTFYTYDPDSNFLIRNFSVDSSIDWSPFRALKLSFSHRFRSQDEGSYVEGDDGIERYGKNSERDNHSVGLNLTYKLFGFIDVKVSQSLSTQKRWNVEDGARELAWEKFDTTLSGKASADYELPSGTKLKFNVARTYRDATNIIDRQREVWDISLNIDKTF
ncbi:MAG: hypothetical protein GF400_03870 [Candidatus Eisenbacteria bacterium]|nr:hypothetical protein [Candidatus Eisenbacteria bacterium]